MPISKSADHLTEMGAAKLARHIRAYWEKRGLRGFRVWVEQQKFMKGTMPVELHVVRSNIGTVARASLIPAQGRRLAA